MSSVTPTIPDPISTESPRLGPEDRMKRTPSVSVPFPDMREVAKTEEVKRTTIGIDLGTTFSCVAVWKGGQVHVIPNSHGDRTTPSVVGFTDTDRLVGLSARSQASKNPENTIFESKRLIGRQMTDRVVRDDVARFPFKVVPTHHDREAELRGAEATKPGFEVQWLGRTHVFHAEQIAAVILADLKLTAENYLDTAIKDAVITVPAYFNDAQRQATKDAGTIAGLNVLRVLNEPTAAALAYGLDMAPKSSMPASRRSSVEIADCKLDSVPTSPPLSILASKTSVESLGSSTERKVLVFDLGGGTFDVSLLTIEDGFFEVKATSGDTHLGGEDFDNILLDFCVEEFVKLNPSVTVDEVSGNPAANRRLRGAVEKAKCLLSSKTEATVSVPSLISGIDLSMKLSRDKFESLCLPLFRRCMTPVEQVLRDAIWGREEVHDVVLVGGSTRVPRIRSMLSEFFGGKKPCSRINPDEAVAYGAAIQAAVLSGMATSADLEKLLLLDVVPLSLGVEMAGGEMSVVIPRNTPIPTMLCTEYTTYNDSQEVVTIKVFEGERPLAKDNHMLGTFSLSGIPALPRGIPKIVVLFNVDENGILAVSATDQTTGKSSQLMITDEKGRLTEDLIDQMVSEAEQYAKEDDMLKATLKAHAAMESFLHAVKTCADAVTDCAVASTLAQAGTALGCDDPELCAVIESVTDEELAVLRDVYSEYTEWWKTAISGIDSAKIINSKQVALERKLGTKLTGVVKTAYSKISAHSARALPAS